MYRLYRLICRPATSQRSGFLNAYRNRSTIFALSSGHSRSAIAVIRISGPKSSRILETMARLKFESVEPRKCLYRKIIDPDNGEVLDNGLVVWFPGPKSYTGEDSAELHIHGGLAVIASVIKALQKFPGCRIAEPGEFTKRAFLAGKLDATEVEGLSDLLQAETEIQRRQALRQASGELGKMYNEWRTQIVNHMAHLEAFIDFGEDQDIGSKVLENLSLSIDHLFNQLECHLNDNRRGERTRSGVKVAIVGEPNVGKSSLLNLLSQRQVAIVSPFAGTTRDVLESSLDVGGYPIVLCDTAGLRLSNDPVENEGLKRARDAAEAADIIILVVDAERLSSDFGHLSADDFIVSECRRLNIRIGSNQSRLLLINKTDLIKDGSPAISVDKHNISAISCKTGQGLEQFLELFKSRLAELCTDPLQEAPLITSTRQRFYLENCHQHLQDFKEILRHPEGDLALAGQKLRLAARQIGYISGQIENEEMLDVLFRSFCIGK